MLQCWRANGIHISHPYSAFISLCPVRSWPSNRNPRTKAVIEHRLRNFGCHSAALGRRQHFVCTLGSPSHARLGEAFLHSYASNCGGVPAGSRSELVLSDAQRRTIYALSTPPGKAGVGVIRISGPDALEAWRGMVRTRSVETKGKARECEPEPWKLHRCRIVHPHSGELLDDGLAVFFKGEHLVFTTVGGPFDIESTLSTEVFYNGGRRRVTYPLRPRHHFFGSIRPFVLPFMSAR